MSHGTKNPALVVKEAPLILTLLKCLPHTSADGRISTNNNNSFSMPNTQDGATTSGTKEKVRQKSTNKKLTEHTRLGGAKPRIEIHNDLTVSLGPWAAAWSTKIGITVRKHVPLCFRTWER